MRSAESAPFQAVIASPIPGVACLGIRCSGNRASAIALLSQSRPLFVEVQAVPAVTALEAYLAAARPADPAALAPAGTPYQQRVWRELCAIPCGSAYSYGELARRLGTSPRAVAGACRANPLPLLIPCHRVVAVNGPGGYLGQRAGNALAIKQWLLQHEGYVPHERAV